ncbi:MAG: type II toxin-antitoxin system VapC family toxin [Verrucomicrobiota bacterium]
MDTSVLLDLVTEDETWFDWSARQIENLAQEHLLAINPVIYAELSPAFDHRRDMDRCLAPFTRLELPYEAAWAAGKAHEKYAKRGGHRIVPLPDFFIGAHAEVSGLRLLTRDARRIRTYFPRVALVCP